MPGDGIKLLFTFFFIRQTLNRGRGQQIKGMIPCGSSEIDYNERISLSFLANWLYSWNLGE
jgi:hypothetical protein